MTITLTREEAQQVLDALSTEGIGENSYRTAELLRARLSAPEPEPVAWMHRQGNYTEPHSMRLDDDAKARGWTEEPLYAALPQREWKGLTDEEISELIRNTHNTGSFVRAIEAKLRAKNSA